MFTLPIVLFICSANIKHSQILMPHHQSSVDAWIQANPGYRMGIESDCKDNAEQIQQIRKGAGGAWKPNPNYQPYYQICDFNKDGQQDFAVAVIAPIKYNKRFRVLVFNGPFYPNSIKQPKFISELMDLSHNGLCYGPPRPEPHYLILGPFESEGISTYI